MKILALLICLCIAARAQLAPSFGAFGANPLIIAPASSWFFDETFDPTGPAGYDHTWSENNNPDEDYTSTTLYNSTQCLYMGTTSTSYTYTTVGDRDNVYIYCRFRYVSMASTSRFWSLLVEDSAGNDLGACSIKDTDGLTPFSPVLRAEGTGGSGNADINLSADTTYHVWVEVEKGTGANAKTRVYVSTDGTKGTVDSEITNGTWTAQPNRLKIACAANCYYMVDTVIIHTSAIGDNPWP